METSTMESKIAILGGGEEELSVLSEFHKTPGVRVIGIYDSDPRSVALEIAEILSIPTFSDDSFVQGFIEADYVLVTGSIKAFEREIEMLKQQCKPVMNPTELAGMLRSSKGTQKESKEAWPAYIDQALEYIERVTDRGRMLKWLLETAVRAIGATSGSIMLYASETRELYIGYAQGLSEEIVSRCRQRLGDGIAGEVAERREARLITDVVDTPFYRGCRERDKIQSAISAPIVHEARLLGILNVSTDRGEKRLGTNDLQTIVALAERIAPILEKHLRIDLKVVRDLEYQIRQYLEALFSESLAFHEKFNALCAFLSTKLSAQSISIYTATDEGNWLILGGSDKQILLDGQYPRLLCNGGSLARAYLDGEEIVLTQSVPAEEEAKPGKEPIVATYVPLFHSGKVGVLVAEFCKLSAFETFMRLKYALRFQVSFFANALINEARQVRRLQGFEELASVAPALLSIDNVESRLDRIAEFLTGLVKASCGSIVDIGAQRRKSAHYRYPADEKDKRRFLELEREVLKMVIEKGEPVCMGYFGKELDAGQRHHTCQSIIAFPIFRSAERTVIYIGYNKFPVNPVDAAVFGDFDIALLEKTRDLLSPLFSKSTEEGMEAKGFGFDDLLRYNQRLMMDRIREEIERAKRYHHAFVLTAFKLAGLTQLFEKNRTQALSLVNELSKGIRLRIRKTDFFSWLEVDLFVVLSIEEHSRMTFLEERIESFIVETLKFRGIYDPQEFFPAHGYSLYPGDAATAPELMSIAKSRIG